MKAIILTISAGGGHHTTTKAIDAHFKELGIETVMIDAYKYFNVFLSNTVEKGYLLSTKYAPALYGGFYRIAEKRTNVDIDMKFGGMGTSIVFKQFVKFVQKQNADVVIATHIFAAELLTMMREKNVIDATLIGIITDFTIHPFWEETNLDYYVTASELLNYQMHKKNIGTSKILPFGIPIHPKFSVKMSKEEAREQLGIKNKTTVMVMTGSMGYGSVFKYIKALDESPMEFQLICVCGNNKKLKKRLDNYISKKDMLVFGFATNVDVIMDAADYLVTKPGGLSVSEALAKGLPLILIDPIPGQEDRNQEFLLNAGVALAVTKTHPVDEAIYQIMNNKAKEEVLPKIIEGLGKPFAGRELGEFVLGLKNNSSASN